MALTKHQNWGPKKAEVVSTVSHPAPSSQHLFKLLTSSSGGNNLNLAGATSSSPRVFSYQCPANRVAYIEQVNVVALDVGVDPEKFLGSTEDQFLSVYTYDTNTTSNITDYVDGLNSLSGLGTIGNNTQWALLSGSDVEIQNSNGANPDQVIVRWHIHESGAVLQLTSGQELRFRVNKPSSGIDEWRAMAIGVIFTTTGY